MNTPSRREEITADWLTHVLREGGHLRDGKVVQIKTRPLGAGIGFLSTITHVALEYDRSEPDAPSSLVVKLEASSDAMRALGDEVQAFEREVRFYQDVAPVAHIRVPRCYYAVLGAPSSALILEDLTDATRCDQVKGLHADQVLEIAHLIGRLQGEYWDNERLASLTWMPTSNRRFWVNLDSDWDSFVDDFDGEIDSAARQLGQRVRGKCQWLEQETDRRPRTLVHSDLKADNILWGAPGTAESVLILDWQLAMRNMGAFDVARLMGGSELPKERHGHQREVLRAWYDGVQESEVNYDWEEALRDLRLGALQMIGWAVNFYIAVADSGGRPRQLVSRICERALDSAVEMDAASVLPRD